MAQIAKSQLDKQTIERINVYLTEITWDEAACWMDEIKSTNGIDYMHEWHYVNVPKDKTYVKGKKPDLVSQLRFFINIIKYRDTHSTATIFEALKIVFHLVADMAQPLHCGYPADKGGTLVPLVFMNRQTTLHRIWDSELIEETKIDIWTCSKKLLSLTPQQRQELKTTDVAQWLSESRSLLDSVYNYKDGIADKDYIERSHELIEMQLIKAGLRLSAVLSTCFR